MTNMFLLIRIPVNSRVQGASWSQIQATGSYFGDMSKPKVVVKVGNEGDVGTMEVVEMIFSVKGPTAGAIMVEWNVHESSQGAGTCDRFFMIPPLCIRQPSADMTIESCYS